MAIDKITKKVDLNLPENISESKKKKIQKEIGDYLVDEILRSLSSGQSPVVGESFKQLNKKYAKEEKGGNRTPNLELDGDMLDALKYKVIDGSLEVGIFKSSELGKADGHNKWSWSNNRKIPKRRFIPKPSQNFKKSIRDGIKSIVNEYKDSEPTSDPFTSILVVEESQERVDIQVGDLFNDDFLEQYLRDEGLI